MSENCCPSCGAKMVKYRFGLNKGLCSALIKLFRHGGRGSPKDLNLTNSEYSNFPKLHYWGLIAKDDNTSSVWKLTLLGAEFVAKKRTMKQYVVTYRGTPIEWTGKDMLITDAYGPYDLKPYYVHTRQGVVSRDDLFGHLPSLATAGVS